MPAKASSIPAAKSLGAPNVNVIAMNKDQLELLADMVQNHFTPYGLRCSCAGQHPDCAGVREDEVVQIQMALLREVSKYIKRFSGFEKRVPDAPHSPFCRSSYTTEKHPNDCAICKIYFAGFEAGRSTNES